MCHSRPSAARSGNPFPGLAKDMDPRLASPSGMTRGALAEPLSTISTRYSLFATHHSQLTIRHSLHNLLIPIALCVEQGAQIGVVDAGMGRFRHDGLGAEGDAEAGFGEHGEIIRAIAHGQRFGR
jgi:hypothetical protein